MFEIMVQELDGLHDGEDTMLGENGLELPATPGSLGKLEQFYQKSSVKVKVQIPEANA